MHKVLTILAVLTCLTELVLTVLMCLTKLVLAALVFLVELVLTMLTCLTKLVLTVLMCLTELVLTARVLVAASGSSFTRLAQELVRSFLHCTRACSTGGRGSSRLVREHGRRICGQSRW